MKTECFVTLPGQEPVWNMAPGRTAVLKLQNEQTGQNVMAFEEITPAGAETPLHLHHNSDEVMYVLSGQYTFKVGDHFSSGGPGTCVFMPRGIPHAWKNRELKRGGRSSYTHPARRAKCSRSQCVYSALRRLRRQLTRRSPSFSAVTAGKSLGLHRSESNSTERLSTLGSCWVDGR